VCKTGLKGAYRRTLSVREFLASKQITVLEHPIHQIVPKDKRNIERGILMTLMTSGVIQWQL
jgi:hypothetical protein